MIVNVPTLEELTARIWAAISESTGLTDTSESAVGYNIAKACAAEALSRWETLAQVERAHDFSTAYGADLDKLGEMFGVYRQRPSTASTKSSPRDLKFTNNGAGTVTVPEGTRVWDPQNPDISYFTTLATNINAGQQAYIPAAAPAQGASYNVGANRLTSHNVVASSVTVTNEIPITSGSDTEDDDTYRSRISNALLRLEGPNLTTVRSVLMEVPGVRNVTLFNLSRGTGTLDALIEGYDREIPDAVLSACQSILDDTVAAGISAKARGPVLKYVDVSVQVVIKSTGSLTSVKSSISEAIRGYVDNLTIEDGTGIGTLYMSELAARIQESSPDIITSRATLTVDGIPALSSDQRLQFGSKFVSQAVIVR